MANIKNKFISKLQKSHTQDVLDGNKIFKLTLGQLNGVTYVVLHDHPDLNSFGVFEPVPVKKVEALLKG